MKKSNPVADCPATNTALHGMPGGYLFNGILYIHNSKIIEWPNRELAKLLMELPISSTPWRKVFGDPTFRGQYTSQGVDPSARMILGYKNDCYFVTEKWLADLSRGSTMVEMYVPEGTNAEAMLSIIRELILKVI